MIIDCYDVATGVKQTELHDTEELTDEEFFFLIKLQRLQGRYCKYRMENNKNEEVRNDSTN